MQAHDDLELQEYVAAVAVTRLLLGPKARVQAPPNLSDSTELGLLLRAGVDDWGGVSPLTPDHVNPERPWPNIDKLAALSRRGRASSCASGWPPSRRTCCSPSRGWTRGCARTSFALAGPDGLAVEGRAAGRAAVAGAGRGVDVVGPGRPARRGGHRRADRRTGAATSTPSTATGRSCATGRRRRATGTPRRWPPATARCCAALLHAEQRPGRAVRRRVPGAAGRRRHRPRGLCALADAVRARRQRRRRHLRREPEHQLHQRLLHRLPVLRLRPAAHRRRRLHAVDGAGRRPGRRGVGGRRRPRSACRAASTPTCPGRRTSTWPAR